MPALISDHRIKWIALLIAAGAVHYAFGGLAAAPIWLLAAAMLLLLRIPRSRIPSLSRALLSPVYGTVRMAERGHDPYLDRPSLCVRLRVSLLGPFVVRSPYEGKVTEIWTRCRRHHGDGWNGETSTGHAICIESDEGDQVVMAISEWIPGWWWLRRVEVGERIGQGQLYGFVLFGGIAELQFPDIARLSVTTGEQVHAGRDTLAELMRD